MNYESKQLCSCDVPCILGGEKHGGLSDLVGFANPAEWNIVGEQPSETTVRWHLDGQSGIRGSDSSLQAMLGDIRGTRKRYLGMARKLLTDAREASYWI